MASGSSSEVVHCPNCKEDVPKTLYCLNCGFPLYKEEQPKEEKVEKPDMKEISVAPDEDAVIVVDEPVEEVAKPEAKPEAAPELTQEVKPIEPIESSPPLDSVGSASEPLNVEKKEAEKAPEPTPIIVEEPKQGNVVPSVTEVPSTPQQQMESTDLPKEPLSAGVEDSKIEAAEMVDEYLEEAKSKGYVPDPLSKDLVDNLAKNIALKLKLVKLYRDGVVKEETFIKVFDEYSRDGKIWSSRREELLKKNSTEVEEIEEANANASEALELLEIKRSIGDVSENEYIAKAPGYRWDIDHFDFMFADRNNKIAYLEDIGAAMSKDELKELKELASLEYNTLDALQISKEETLSSIKESLYEAIKILG
ncbi:MAG: hypothetical protein ABSA11_03490 [Candidatus Bathyarchaeia archaeon]|jgi:hypothetical protein